MATDPHVILDDLILSEQQREAVDLYYSNPKSRNFLPVVDILLSHGAEGEAIHLLVCGLVNHPSYTVARIKLSQLYFNRGDFQQAWQALEASPVGLQDNITAQLIKFKVALILRWDDLFRLLIAKLRSEKNIPRFERDLIIQFDRFGVEEAYGFCVRELERLGIHLRRQGGESQKVKDGEISDADRSEVEGDTFVSEDSISGFFVAPLWQIFDRFDETAHRHEAHDLDSLTLVKVYKDQGFYEKALEILKRFVFLAPENDLLQREWIETKALFEEQKLKERSFDPVLAERMNQVQGLNSRLNKLQNFLKRLDDHERTKQI